MSKPELVARPAHLPQRDQLGESPFWDDAAQCLWWVDIVGKRIQRLDPASGEVRGWAAPHYVSGVIPREGGGLVAALTHGVHFMNLGSGLFDPFVAPDDDPRNRSNEFRCDAQGRLWLGTMWNNIGPNGEDAPVEQATGKVFCIAPDGATTQLLSGIGITNTFVWSPDGARMAFADTKARTMWSFAYDADGPTLSDRRVLVGPDDAPGNPDGSAMDEEGCIWNARWGAGQVVRITPDGRIDRVVDVPAAQPSCPAFGGPDRKTLYITTARQGLKDAAPDSLDGGLFALPVNVAGLPLHRFAG